jgi:very-short-patch-repair endonuclease
MFCLICNKKFLNNKAGQFTSHLKKIHDLSLEDYEVFYVLKKEPKCFCGFCSNRPEFYRGKFKKYHKGHHRNSWFISKYIEKNGSPKCQICGKNTFFCRKKPKLFCSTKCFTLSENFKGFNDHNTQLKIRKNNLEKYGFENVFQTKHIRSIVSNCRKNAHILHTKESKLKISQAITKVWKNEEYKKRVLSSIWKSSFNRLSKLHMKIRNDLFLEKYGFKSEQVVNKYCVDELNEKNKIIIEINGDYVHANPRIYKSNDVIKLRGNAYTAQEKWENDQRKKEYLENLGYEVLIIWESDNLETIKQALIEKFK